MYLQEMLDEARDEAREEALAEADERFIRLLMTRQGMTREQAIAFLSEDASGATRNHSGDLPTMNLKD